VTPDRYVSKQVLSAHIDIPALPSRLTTDCEREIRERFQLTPGDVEALSLARARTRWPGYRIYLQAIEAWMGECGMPGLLGGSEIALMACRGARYHHDANDYGGHAFCNLFLSEAKGLDLHFPYANKNIHLQRGSAVIFDTAQPHAVTSIASMEFSEDAFTPEKDCTLLFLTWELPITSPALASALGFNSQTVADSALQLVNGLLLHNNELLHLCPRTGKSISQ
jgi:hypothetical protein